MNLKKFSSFFFFAVFSLTSIVPIFSAQELVQDTSGGDALKVLVLTIVSLLKDKEEVFKIETQLDHPISFLQNKIEEKTNIPAQHQQLAFKKTYLDPQNPLSAYPIHDGAELCVFERTKALKFSKLENKIEMKSENDEGLPSKGLEFFPGLNLVGACKNQNCDATYKHQVMAPKGFGKFELLKERRTTRCPCCNAKLTNISSCAFSYCKYLIEGEKVNGGDFSKQGIHRDIQGSELFLAGDDENDETYYYLTITVKKLK